ncbi:MAG: hypothetical protein MR297_00410 [Tenericutes bacterium]|nr:hypothetical protein [Mycoplasmatota bacterium]
MNKKVKYIILGVLLLLIASLVVYFVFIKKDNNTDNIKFSKEYTSVSKDNVFVYRSKDEIINILEHGIGIVYLGYPECPWCMAYVVLLNEIAKNEGIEKIYYYNIREDRKNNTEFYQKVVSILNDYLNYDEEGKKRIFVPNVTFVKEGKIIFNDNETSLISEGTPSEYWTEEKKTLFNEKFRKNINELLDDVCNSCNE